MTLTSTQARTLAWLLLAVALWWLTSLLAPVLKPFLVAAVMAYALHPAVERLHDRGLPRWIGAGISIIVLMLLLLAVALLIVPVVTAQIPLLRDQIPALLERFNLWFLPWATRLGLEVQVDVNGVSDLLRRLLAEQEEGKLVEQLLASLRIGGSALAAVLGFVVLTPIVAYYLLLDWDALVKRGKTLVPPRWQERVQSFLDETDAVLGQYLRGQLLVMAILAVFYSLALTLVGLDLAIPIGVFTGLAVFVPYLGFGVGMVLALLAALLEFQSLSGVLLVALVYMAGQVLESFYLTPNLLGERIGLHPIAVIFALMAFAHLMGFVGVLIALPASAVLLVGIRRARALYLGSTLYTLGTEPHLPSPTSPRPETQSEPPQRDR